MSHYYPSGIPVGFGRHSDFGGIPMRLACVTLMLIPVPEVKETDHVLEFYPNQNFESGALSTIRTNQRRLTTQGKSVCLVPVHGSVWIMDGFLNTHWTHRVYAVNSRYPRITLTFRSISEVLRRTEICRELLPPFPERKQHRSLAKDESFWVGRSDENFGQIFDSPTSNTFKIIPVQGQQKQVHKVFSQFSQFTKIISGLSCKVGRVHIPSKKIILYPAAVGWLYDELSEPENDPHFVILKFCRSISLICECGCCDDVFSSEIDDLFRSQLVFFEDGVLNSVFSFSRVTRKSLHCEKYLHNAYGVDDSRKRLTHSHFLLEVNKTQN
jgi:hypothetical protein